MQRRFRQVDVFAESPQSGNPLAVVVDGDGLSQDEMQRFANWTNLSETTFLLPPTTDEADYRVRIFTPVSELPFAGHPTLGSAKVWLDAGGQPRQSGRVIQECEAGLIPVVREADRLSFRAPPLIRSGPVDGETLAQAVAQLRIPPASVVDSAWIDNGPGWLGILLADAESVLAVEPGTVGFKIGVIGPHSEHAESAFELRAFFPKDGSTVEDPVTGSLNASAAGWLLSAGRASAPYLATQGSALGRSGRVYITVDDQGIVWVGGRVMTTIVGSVEL